VELVPQQPDDPFVKAPDEIRHEHAEPLRAIFELIIGTPGIWSFPIDLIAYLSEQVMEHPAELFPYFIPRRCGSCRLSRSP
jgi:hypothetical protein